ncbi:MerR family transcriptional regulator [Lactobacillus xylocopicola]|uniref:MerR family transcriptional regulator n=1 Tax=Lactobacillus xylocopicola TaxID=2976676 RepID=A0ABM8BEV6_9LACO|nr:MerR family transcriptional regulator [Lactobacillus xylocopicola]BDR59777.1 MerR family transcriptional regulator [Lactobacillus xylocopicola]
MVQEYKISEFSHLVGLSPYTLRYYERENLIIPHRYDNGQRYYTDHDIRWVGFLLHLKGCGMSMNEIKEYVTLRSQGDETIPQRQALLQKVKANSLSKIAEMQFHLKILSHKIDWYDGKLNNHDEGDFAAYLSRFEEEDKNEK